MCIFSGAHPDVSKTRIMVAWVGHNQQLVVYQNDVKLASGKNASNVGTAMILPIPGGDVRMVDLSGYPTLFDDLKRDFPDPVFKGRGGGGTSAKLDVQRVGSYDVSLAASLDELKNLDWTHFALDADVLRLLEHDYGRNFSFCVARLRPDAAGSPHALAYVHSNVYGWLFVPTRHAGHEGQADVRPAKRAKTTVAAGADSVQWDHHIYAYVGEDDSGYGTKWGAGLALKKNAITGAMPEGYVLPVAGKTYMRKFSVKGSERNADTWIVRHPNSWHMEHEDYMQVKRDLQK